MSSRWSTIFSIHLNVYITQENKQENVYPAGQSIICEYETIVKMARYNANIFDFHYVLKINILSALLLLY